VCIIGSFIYVGILPLLFLIYMVVPNLLLPNVGVHAVIGFLIPQDLSILQLKAVHQGEGVFIPVFFSHTRICFESFSFVSLCPMYLRAESITQLTAIRVTITFGFGSIGGTFGISTIFTLSKDGCEILTVSVSLPTLLR